MNRRQALALLGSVAFGGCLGSDRPGNPATTRTTTAGTPATEANTAESTTVGTTTETTTTTDETEQQTTTPEPPELGVADPEGCPPFDDDVKRVVCSPDMDAPLTFGSTVQSGSLPRATFEFVLTNRTNATFGVNFYGWEVWKQEDGEWFRVAPRFVPQPLMYLPAGDSHTWNLTVDNTDLDREIPRAEGTSEVMVAGLGAGTYAFGTDGWFKGQHYENGTGIATRFELTGDSLALTPTGIDRTERDGDTVVVVDEPEGNERRAAYVVTRVESAPEEPRRMITEQVLRRTPLRNALAHFEPGVRQVRLEAGTTTYPPFGVNETRYVEYEGETYSIETKEVGSETTTG